MTYQRPGLILTDVYSLRYTPLPFSSPMKQSAICGRLLLPGYFRVNSDWPLHQDHDVRDSLFQTITATQPDGLRDTIFKELIS